MTRDAQISGADTVHAESRVGQLIAEKYRIERLLGRGGMGEVYEARHVVVGRRFAIKFLHAHLARGRDSGSRFLREAQAAGALDSEQIAAVLDFDTAADGAPFLVMEYLAGESLATVLKREGQLSVPRVLGMLLQICRGLDVAHRAGIVHRDLKPDNLFLTQRPDGSELVKILDFGIAKWVDGGSDGTTTHSGVILGTPFYMAPEQARGEKSVDLRVDIHALGVVAYELLSGKKPHPGESYNAILAHILTQPVVPLATLQPGLPRELTAVIERAMAFEPALRPSSTAELSGELLPFASREVTSVAAHFDLRSPAAADEGAATRATIEAPSPENDGTLQSTMGNVERASSSRERARRVPWSLILVALAIAGFVLVKARGGRSGAADAADSARSASSPAASAATAKAAEPASPPTAAREPATVSAAANSAVPPARSAAPLTERSAKAMPLRAQKPGPTATRAAQKPEISFDEKNPY
ncbi:MAG: serine/threonine-protein kinase [Polyangiaceae bacterium]